MKNLHLSALGTRFLLLVFIPLACAALIAIGTGTLALLWTAKRSDDAHLEQEQRTLQVALSELVSDISIQERSLLLWGELERRLTETEIDTPWMDENVGVWLHQMFGHDETYLLDSSAEPVYSAWEGRRPPLQRFAQVRPAMSTLLEPMLAMHPSQFRPAHPAQSPGPGHETERLDRLDGQLEGLILIDGRLAACAVGWVGSPAKPSLAAQRPAHLMVTLRYIDGPLLHTIGERSAIAGLHFVPAGQKERAATSAGSQRIELKDRAGRVLGELVWRPMKPGTAMLKSSIPAAVTVLSVLLALLGWMAVRLWRSMRDQQRAMLELRASEAQSQHLAFHDMLTGLPNRALLDNCIVQALAAISRSGKRLALLTIDLDHFKQVNDTMGHHVGDNLIREISTRLADCVRGTDVVARVGGDEFVIVQCSINGPSDAQALCERILAVVRQPVNLLGNDIVVGGSIGIAIAPDDATDRNELLRKSDIALYAAKMAGRDGYRFFDQSMDDAVRLRAAIASDLRSALSHERDLSVSYQPLIDAATSKVVGMEALLRWNHPTRGPIRPDEFIPIAEKNGLIVPLGDWVFRKACQTARQWPGLFVAVNVSPVQIGNQALAERLSAIAKEEGCDPSQIELEITEGVLLDNDESIGQALASLRQAGFRIALDDFGTGYSSISYLRRFAVDKIKIDRSFVQSLGASNDAPAIIDSLIGLGQAMGITITAEGVETREQLRYLVGAGCNELQGYLFAHPMRQEQLADAIDQLGQHGHGPRNRGASPGVASQAEERDTEQRS